MSLFYVCLCHLYVFGSPTPGISVSPVLVYVPPLCECINIIIKIIGICVTVPLSCLCAAVICQHISLVFDSTFRRLHNNVGYTCKLSSFGEG